MTALITPYFLFASSTPFCGNPPPLLATIAMRSLLLSLFLLAVISLRAAEPADLRIERDITYLGPSRPELADLYLPLKIPAGKKTPAIVIIHGGGFTGGQRNGNREASMGALFARHGYIAMSIDYALATLSHPSWSQNLYDCKIAVRWLRANAERLHLDPEHIGVVGGSAGGTLASLVALTQTTDGLDPESPYGDFSCDVQCCVDMYGIVDLSEWRDCPMFAHTHVETPQVYKMGSAIRYVREDSPPMLILHGAADKGVEVAQSQNLAKALKAAGVEHELIVIAEAGHGFGLELPGRDLRPTVLGFFDRWLKPAP